MPQAILTPTGSIREVVRKLSPFMKLAADERIVSYDPPEVDETEFTVVAIEPVDAQNQAVQFEVVEIPGAIDRAKAKKNDLINAARLVANTSTFTYQGKLIAVDALSRSDIDAASTIDEIKAAMP